MAVASDLVVNGCGYELNDVVPEYLSSLRVSSTWTTDRVHIRGNVEHKNVVLFNSIFNVEAVS